MFYIGIILLLRSDFKFTSPIFLIDIFMHYAYIPGHYLSIYRHYNNNFIMIFSAYSGNMQSLQYSVDIMPSICRKQRKKPDALYRRGTRLGSGKYHRHQAGLGCAFRKRNGCALALSSKKSKIIKKNIDLSGKIGYNSIRKCCPQHFSVRLTLEGHIGNNGAYPKLRSSPLLESIAARCGRSSA